MVSCKECGLYISEFDFGKTYVASHLLIFYRGVVIWQKKTSDTCFFLFFLHFSRGLFILFYFTLYLSPFALRMPMSCLLCSNWSKSWIILLWILQTFCIQVPFLSECQRLVCCALLDQRARLLESGGCRNGCALQDGGTRWLRVPGWEGTDGPMTDMLQNRWSWCDCNWISRLFWERREEVNELYRIFYYYFFF